MKRGKISEAFPANEDEVEFDDELDDILDEGEF